MIHSETESNLFKDIQIKFLNWREDFKRKSLYRKKMMNMLTIQEAELIYSSFINKKLKESYTDFKTKKKMYRDIPFWKLKLNIRMKISNEKIVYCVPRFEELE